MVLCSNTVIDPRTMVVKPLNAAVANAAMSRTISSNHFTIRAEQHRIKIDQHVLNLSFLIFSYQESNLVGFLKVSRIFKCT